MASLAPTAQVPYQTFPNVVVHATKRFSWVPELEVVRPSLEMTVHLLDEDRDRLEAHAFIRHGS